MWMTVSLIKCEIHQGDKYLRFIAGSLRLFFFFLFAQRDWSNQKYHFPLREQASWHKDNWSLHLLHQKNVPKTVFWLFEKCQQFAFHWGFCMQRTGPISTPQPCPNPEPWHCDLTIRYTHTHMHSNTGPEESGYKFVDTDRKVKNWNTASGLNINCSRGFLSSG